MFSDYDFEDWGDPWPIIQQRNIEGLLHCAALFDYYSQKALKGKRIEETAEQTVTDAEPGEEIICFTKEFCAAIRKAARRQKKKVKAVLHGPPERASGSQDAAK